MRDPDLDPDDDDEIQYDDEDDDAGDPSPDDSAQDPDRDPTDIEPDEDEVGASTEGEPATAATTDEGVGGGSPDEDEVAAAVHPATGRGGRQVRWVAFDDLVLEYKHWVNPRQFTGLDEISIQALADDIRAKTISTPNGMFAGVAEPFKVVQIRQNEEIVQLILDGQRRYRACETIEMGDDTLIPVIDREPEPVDWTKDLADKYLAEVLTAVGTRRDLSSFELAQAAERLRGTKDPDTNRELTLQQIALCVGRSESWVSKILAAMRSASAKLRNKWAQGEITDEQFKDLAAQKDPERQDQAAEEAVKARETGNKADARALAKEQKEAARQTKEREKQEARDAKERERQESKNADKANSNDEKGKAGKAKGKADPEPAVRGPQAELPVGQPAAAPTRKPPSRAVLDDVLHTADQRPPTHDFVKGFVRAIRYVTGQIDATEVGKPYADYLSRISIGTPKGADKAKGKKNTGRKK